MKRPQHIFCSCIQSARTSKTWALLFMPFGSRFQPPKSHAVSWHMSTTMKNETNKSELNESKYPKWREKQKKRDEKVWVIHMISIVQAATHTKERSNICVFGVRRLKKCKVQFKLYCDIDDNWRHRCWPLFFVLDPFKTVLHFLVHFDPCRTTSSKQ